MPISKETHNMHICIQDTVKLRLQPSCTTVDIPSTCLHYTAVATILVVDYLALTLVSRM